MKPENVEGIYELAPLQQGMLLHTLREPDSGVYLAQFNWTFQGELDTTVLRRAWARVVERHAILRTSFHWEDLEKPLQVVNRHVELPVDERDWRDRSAEQQRRQLELALRDDRHRGFDLSRAPLMRFGVIRLADDLHSLTWSFHHVLVDGWSVALLLDELLAFYEAFRNGEELQLPRPRSYRDYIAWLQRQDPEPAERFWREALDGLEAATPLQIGRSRGRLRPSGDDYDSRQLELGEKLAGELKTLARRHRVTLNTLVEGAWALLMSRYSGDRDVVFGVTSSGRPPELEGADSIAGVFLNTLPLRVRVDGDATLPGWLRGILERQTEMRQYGYASLVEIQGWSDVPRHQALFECLLGFENYPVGGPSGGHGFTRGARDVRVFERTNYPISLIANPRRGLSLRALYDSRRFDAPSIERALGHLKTLLSGMVETPEGRLDSLPLLTGPERRELLITWNETARDHPGPSSAHERFEAVAQRHPEALAVSSATPIPGTGERELSYGELNRRANRVAHRLRALGVGPDAHVAVCLERSPLLLVGLLGVLKAGGSYLTLDPSQPRERLAFMVEDARAPVVLTQSRLLGALPGVSAQVVGLESAMTEGPDTDPTPSSGPADAAYVIYTSGSTGRPKGVVIPHDGLMNLVGWHQRVYRVTPADRATQLAALSFDASVWELWPYLTAGASVHLSADETRLSPAALLAWLARERITLSFLPTPLAEAVLAEPLPAGLSLRALLTGGDQLRRAPEAALPFDLVNHYGPTEYSVVSTWTRVEPSDGGDAPPPIGRPIDNTQVLLLDRALQPVPVGVPGEIYVGGLGLARGYLHRPDLTAERFIPHPHTDVPGARLYRTGDVGRYLPGGEIEFLGRIDHQVKIRGYRIELGEIEGALSRHPAVAGAAVVTREDERGQRQLVAYVARGPAAVTASSLREHLLGVLPGYMIPSDFVLLDALPLTAHGKVDAAALPAPERRRAVDEDYAAPAAGAQERVAAIWRQLLGLDRVGVRDNFFDLGGHSMLIMELHARLKDELRVDLPIVELFDHPTIESQARRVAGAREVAAPLRDARSRMERRAGGAGAGAVAIVGMSGRFPGADDIEAFWSLLRDGVEAVSSLSEEELREAGVPEAQLRDPRFVRAHAVVAGQELFDAAFFNYNPREAELIDPQQRLFLECAWEALERAGYDPRRFPGLVGVYAGSSRNGYIANLRSRPELVTSAGAMQLLVSSDKDFLATRVSYKLDLKGPSVNVQTACSTSLVAVHEACRSLVDHQCDLALAGGASLQVPWRRGYLHVEGGVVSPGGRCCAFDLKAQGAVRGDGVAVVVLKRLAEAVADGDLIHAVILGTGVNNDGASKVGYTAPSVEGQARAVALALAAADADPDTISFVEAHGTGTPLGDPIEVAALREVFTTATRRPSSCALGAVKTNIGHLDAAAGIAGLIKTALALERRELPATLHFETPNAKIDLSGSPFFVNDRLRPWTGDGGAPRRAGLSSFGIGGTNAHAVLEEAPARRASGPSRPQQLLNLSARTPEALGQAAAALAGHLREHPELELADIAYTLQVGRSAFEHRRSVLCRDREEAVAALAGGPGRVWSGEARTSPPPVVFMFPGQGAQHVGMARQLYRREAVFRNAFDSCAARFEDELGIDLRELLYPPTGADPAALSELSARLAETSAAQAALFAVELALARLWMSWGVTPSACIGHSIGEYVAACLGEVMSEEDAIGVVARRGRAMAAAPRGVMLAVPLAEQDVAALLDDGLWLAAVNAPSLCVVSGEEPRIAELERRLAERGLDGRRLATSHAFHSGLMEAALAPLLEHLAAVSLHAPSVPFVSNLTGTWITEGQATDPSYWGEHLLRAVRFGDGIGTLLADPARVLLEVGPGRTLTELTAAHLPPGRERRALASLPHPRAPQEDQAAALAALAQLWVAGATIDWTAFSAHETRNRVVLPTYPFQRRRFWIDHRPQAQPAAPEARGRPAKRAEIDEWLYVPVWRRTAPVPAIPLTPGGRWCLLDDRSPLGEGLAAALCERGQEVVTVAPGPGFGRDGERRYRVSPSSSDDFRALLRELDRRELSPERIVHLWGSLPTGPGVPAPERRERIRHGAFESLIGLAKALGRRGSSRVALSVVTTEMQDVTGSEPIAPLKAIALGPSRVIPMEYPHLRCRSVDWTPPAAAPADDDAELLLRELVAGGGETAVAYRGRYRWAQTYEALPPAPGVRAAPPLRHHGTYLITGGLGGIGLSLAEHLAARVQARLILTCRSELCPADAWDRWLSGHDPGDATSRRIRRIRAMQAAGAEVVTERADVADADEMRGVIARARSRFGAIHGVVHAAGTTRGPSLRAIEELQLEDCEAQFRPKVQGVVVLDELLAREPLDFAVFTSSLSSVAGGLFLSAYAGANAFMDAFAQHSRRNGGIRWTSVNLDGWDHREPSARPADGAAELSMTREEGVAVFERSLLHDDLPQVIVSTADLAARMAEWSLRAGDRPASEPVRAEPSSRHPRPPLQNPYQPPRTVTEKTLAELWQEYLGVDEVGVNDNFFELGGHSLLATQLLAALRERFDAPLSIATLFAHPTVHALGRQLDTGGDGRAVVVGSERGGRRKGALMEVASRRRRGEA